MAERFDTVQDAVEYLTRTTDYERMQHVRYNADTFSLDRMTALADAMGHPERRLTTVHIAGTKGKGSTAAITEAILRAHGLRTGLYTSPHLFDLRERIQIDRAWIDTDLMRRMTERAAEAVATRLAGESPTFFELLTAIALAAFAVAEVDVAVVEVGLGGRLDATNIITPTAAVITRVSIDHVHQLGSDLVSIAREKAGIIKAGVPLVLAPQFPEVAAVIHAAAARAGAPVIRVGGDVRVAWDKAFIGNVPASRVTVGTPRADYPDLLVPLGGRFQAMNTACAIAAAERILGDRVQPTSVRTALADLDWPGRMQAFPGRPTVILDGAHNADSLRRLLVAVGEYYPGCRTVVVFAAAADKDIPGMCRILSDNETPVVFTRTENPRAADPDQLAASLRAAGGHVLGTSLTVAGAMQIARGAMDKPPGGGASAAPVRPASTAAPAEGVLVVCGSLYLVGTILESPEAFGLNTT